MSKIIDKYVLQQSVGCGQYGKVYQAYHTETGQVVAIKVIKLERFKQVPKLANFTMNEITTLQNMKNNNIIQFIEMLRTLNNIYLVYEFCNGGNLDDQIKQQGFIREPLALEYYDQMLEAFETLSQNNILHRDLKPSNILLHNDRIKVADFGFCKALEGPMDLTQTMVGSPIYMAPEILKGEPYTLSSDIWSLGVTLFECLFGKCPFEDVTIPRLMFQIQTRSVQIPLHIQNVGEGTQWLLRRMLTVDPTQRITWQELFTIRKQNKEAYQRNMAPQATASSSSLFSRQSKKGSYPTTPTQFTEQSSQSPINQPSPKRYTSPSRLRSPNQRYVSPNRASNPPTQKPNLPNETNSARNRMSRNYERSRSPGLRVLDEPSRLEHTSPLNLRERSKSPQRYLISQRLQSNNVSVISSISTTKNLNENNNQVKLNLRSIQTKRQKIFEQLQTAEQIIEMSEKLFNPLPQVGFVILGYVQALLKQMVFEITSPQQPQSWEVFGSWKDFSNSPQFQKCQQIIIQDCTKIDELMSQFKGQISLLRESIEGKTIQALRKSVVRQCLEYLNELQKQIERVYEPVLQSKLVKLGSIVAKYTSEVCSFNPKIWNYPSVSEVNKLNNYILQLKSFYLTQMDNL